MMKQVLLSLLLSSGFAALSASSALAQTTPNTTQTDQSEEDWRKSKKKSDTSDPLDGFKNMNGWGQGVQRTTSPIDMLPEDSRRFLMKERAQRLAEAGVGEAVDTSFEPSDAAKSDPDLASDEKAAWSEMMKDMGGSAGQPPAGDPNGDPNAQPGAAGSAPQIPTQVGEVGGAGTATPSVMRGGSSASVSDILAQIKGGGSAPSGQMQGQGQQGQMSQGQMPQGQMPQGQAPTAAQMQGQAQAQNQAQNQGQAQGQAQSQSTDTANAQAAANASAQAQAQADAQSSAQDQAQQAAQAAQAAAAAQAQAAAAARTPEAISPLDRLKQTRDERASTGKRSSASDYLKRGGN